MIASTNRKLKILNFVTFTVETEPPRAAPTLRRRAPCLGGNNVTCMCRALAYALKLVNTVYTLSDARPSRDSLRNMGGQKALYISRVGATLGGSLPTVDLTKIQLVPSTHDPSCVGVRWLQELSRLDSYSKLRFVVLFQTASRSERNYAGTQE